MSSFLRRPILRLALAGLVPFAATVQAAEDVKIRSAWIEEGPQELTVAAELECGLRRFPGFQRGLEVFQFPSFRNFRDLVLDQRLDVFVKNIFLLVGEFFEALEGAVEFPVAKAVA